MAELHWKYGYHMFWTLSIVLTLLSCLLMYKGGMLKNRETSWASVVKKEENQVTTKKSEKNLMSDGLLGASDGLSPDYDDGGR
jgi:hypothetical protein